MATIELIHADDIGTVVVQVEMPIGSYVWAMDDEGKEIQIFS